MKTKNDRIGIIDSGVGGLATVKACLQRLPYESLVYIGDNAFCPYGVIRRIKPFRYRQKTANESNSQRKDCWMTLPFSYAN